MTVAVTNIFLILSTFLGVPEVLNRIERQPDHGFDLQNAPVNKADKQYVEILSCFPLITTACLNWIAFAWWLLHRTLTLNEAELHHAPWLRRLLNGPSCLEYKSLVYYMVVEL